MPRLKRDYRPPCRFAFTIPELLAVIAIIIIMLSILLPSLQGGKEAAWTAECASNQHQIRIAMQNTNKMHDGIRFPNAGNWTTMVRKYGAAHVLNCPKGEHAGETPEEMLDNVYSVQDHGNNNLTFSYVSDIKQGNLGTDHQLGRVYRGGITGDLGENGAFGNWPAFAYERSYDANLDSEYMAVTYNDDAGYVVEYTKNPVRIVSLDPPTNEGPFKRQGDADCGSKHWVCMGESGPDWKGEIILKLTGTDYVNIVDPPVEVGSSHYGMNTQVDPNKLRGSQLLTMDYKKTIIKVGDVGNFIDDFEVMFSPRHYDKANVQRVDGSIGLMSRGELDAGEDIWLNENPNQR